MTIRPYTRKQWTKEELQDICDRYLKGETLVSIGSIYGKDRTTIMHWLKKCGVYHKLGRVMPKIEQKKKPKRKLKPVPKPKNKYDHLIFERVNPGKTYEEYLRDEKRRVAKQENSAI